MKSIAIEKIEFKETLTDLVKEAVEEYNKLPQSDDDLSWWGKIANQIVGNEQ